MSQIKTKFIEDNAATDAKVRLRNNQPLRARNAADSADIDILKVSAADVLQIVRETSLQSNKIIDLASPTAATDAANKAYVDAAIAGISDPKDPVRLATTAVLPSVTYANGTGGVGATLTATANGALGSIDGVAVALNDRILVKDQAAGLQNGIYTASDLGSAGTPFILTRATDSDSEITFGMFTTVLLGTANTQQSFLQSTADPITVGTTALVFTKFGENTIAGAGLGKTGSTLSVNVAGGLEITGDDVTVKEDSSALSLQTIKISGSAEVVGTRNFEESFTLGAGDITNQYVDLAKVASQGSVGVLPLGGPMQRLTADYTLNYTGGTGSKTRVSFAGDLATGGNAALVAGDILSLKYESLDY